MTHEQWQDPQARCFGVVLDGRAQPTGIRRRGADATILVVLNAHHGVVEFALPAVPGGDSWLRLIDTNVPDQIRDAPHDFNEVYEVAGRSFLLFTLEHRARLSRAARTGRGALLDIAEQPFRRKRPDRRR